MAHVFLVFLIHLVSMILSPPLLLEFPELTLTFQHWFLHLLLSLAEGNLSNRLGTDLGIILLTFFFASHVWF